MKILLIIYNLGGTASGIISYRVAKELACQGHEVVVFTSSVSVLQKITDFEIITHRNLISDSFYRRIVSKIGSIIHSQIPNINYSWAFYSYLRIKRMLKDWTPDWVYCRTFPIEPCLVGNLLKKNLRLKVLQHFTDPIPAPKEYIKDIRMRVKLEKIVIPILRNADLLSFGTQAMMEYEQSLIPFNILNKSFVSPDIASSNSLRFLSMQESKVVKFVFYGSIYGNRQPQILFNVIQDLIKMHKYNCEFLIYAPEPKKKIYNYNFIKYLGRINNPIDAFAQSTILVDIDGDDSFPVFISSKLKDYLLVNRPILSITPSNSPVNKLVHDLKTIKTTQNNYESIFKSIQYILASALNDDDYLERNYLIQLFSPESVVNEIIKELS
jgi:hypothetical protein